ncbi:MAG TPA: M20 family metallopeptidase [Chloroflexota bacterium]|nr:M20 family metallopeptidase [Chloroflexota bacterium]
MAHELVEFAASKTNSFLEFLEELVASESPTDSPPGVERAQSLLASCFGDIGAEVEPIPGRDGFGPHLLAHAGTGSEQVLVVGHVDTVWPLGTLARMPYQRDGERIAGPGIYDMKGGIALIWQALAGLRELGRTGVSRLAILITSDEEVGSPTSRWLVEELARQSKAVLVFEPGVLPAGAVKTARKGVGLFKLKVGGKAAHAGNDPDRGRSAICELARQIVKLETLADRASGVSINVGVIRGGTRPNVVAAEAEAEVDLRVATMAQALSMERAILGLEPLGRDVRIEVSGGLNRPPMERSAHVAGLYEQVRGLAEDIGLDLPEQAVGGGSDGNFTAALGVPTLDGLGVVGAGAHADHEHIRLSHLPNRLALTMRLFEAL